ncbi:putative eukaryotic translation initiation factor 2A-like [Apostichopus japonicus]|uniref:Putative eukaryotic translation initiation factor 2A-like n=1 Tax=Stichopus japonicus TaxID=307972 RepID=A0A2G8JMC7_STIJA|nr:putative eukaryotic translation initiation factor 2A-like [Apostichopus japonicus]
MADNDPSSGKTSKKNRKRRGKKEGGNKSTGTVGVAEHIHKVDPVEDLRQKLSEAKLAKDNELANRLRQQLWIAQDLSAGIEPNISAEDSVTLALVQEVKNYGIGQPAKEPASGTPVISSMNVGDADSKRLKNLRKKLAQIEKLKEKQRNGEKIESNQLEKINSEEEVREELRHVEELLSIPVKI